jgi:hypothetical protein
VRNIDVVQYLEQGTTETLSVMCIVDLCETEKQAFTFPHSRNVLFDPVSSDSKITISVTSLPPIASDVHCSANSIALKLQLDLLKRYK